MAGAPLEILPMLPDLQGWHLQVVAAGLADPPPVVAII
jgi:hypothetical protein